MQYIMTEQNGMRSLAVRTKPIENTIPMKTDQGIVYPVLVDEDEPYALNIRIKANGKTKAFSSTVNCILFDRLNNLWLWYLDYEGKIIKIKNPLSFTPKNILFDKESGLYIMQGFAKWAYSADGITWHEKIIYSVTYNGKTYNYTDNGNMYRVLHVYVDQNGFFSVVIWLELKFDEHNYVVQDIVYNAEMTAYQKKSEYYYGYDDGTFGGDCYSENGLVFIDNGLIIKDHVISRNSLFKNKYLSYGSDYWANSPGLYYGEYEITIVGNNYGYIKLPEAPKGLCGVYNGYAQIREHENNEYQYYLIINSGHTIKNPYRIVAYDPVSKYYIAVDIGEFHQSKSFYKGLLDLSVYKWEWTKLIDWEGQILGVSPTQKNVTNQIY